MSGPNIRIKIGALVLHGASYPEVGPLAAALQRELGRLLSQQGGGAAALVAAPPRRGHVDAGTFASALGRAGAGGGRTAAAATDGARIAGSVYRGLTNASTAAGRTAGSAAGTPGGPRR